GRLQGSGRCSAASAGERGICKTTWAGRLPTLSRAFYSRSYDPPDRELLREHGRGSSQPPRKRPVALMAKSPQGARITVTGAGGFLGPVVVDALAAQGCGVQPTLG